MFGGNEGQVVDLDEMEVEVERVEVVLDPLEPDEKGEKEGRNENDVLLSATLFDKGEVSSSLLWRWPEKKRRPLDSFPLPPMSFNSIKTVEKLFNLKFTMKNS